MTQRSLVVSSLLLACGAVLAVAREQVLTGDPTYYIELARALTAGSYSIMGVAHTTYPPGLPLLLTPVVALRGADVLAAQVFVALFAPASAIAVWRWSRGALPAASGWITLLLCSSVGFFALATDGVRTELPFLTVTAVLLHLVQRGSPRDRWIVAGLLAALAVLLRTIGIALPAACLVAWGQDRVLGKRGPHDRALLSAGVGGLLAFAGWLAWGAWQGPGDDSYLRLLRMVDPHHPDLGVAGVLEIVARAPRALIVQLTHVGELLTGIPWLAPAWSSPVVVTAAVCLGTGIARDLRGPDPVTSWYVLAYGAILLLWPFDEGVRFVVPVFPFVLALLWKGARGMMAWAGDQVARRWLAVGCGLLAASGLLSLGGFSRSSGQGRAAIICWTLLGLVLLAGRVPPPSRRGLRLLVAGAFAIVLVPRLVQILPRAATNLRGTDTSVHASLRPALTWLSAHTGTGERIMAGAPFESSIRFYTGRGVATLPATRRAEALRDAVERAQPHWLVIHDAGASPYYLPTEQERLVVLQRVLGPGLIREAFRYDGGVIYDLRPSQAKVTRELTLSGASRAFHVPAP